MFGTKLRTWMEAHIVRSKKKKDRKKCEKGFDSNCNSPRNHGTNRSPALYQVHPVDSATKNVDGIRLHREGGRCGTVSASSATSAGNGSVNLSSPESAYSTGYSTDGTSPGTSYPPEYYINIRTGTHYFQSNANIAASTIAIAPTGNITTTTTSNHHHRNNNNNNDDDDDDDGGNSNNGSNNNNNITCNNNNNNSSRSKRPIGTPEFPSATLLCERRHAKFDGNVELTASTSTAIFASGNTSTDCELSGELQTNTPSKIDNCLASDDGTTGQSARPEAHRQEGYHRRTEPFSADSPPSSVHPPTLSPMTQSPRERSRIRTNPWLLANSCGPSTAGIKYKQNLDDTSSGSGLRLTESSGSVSDVNASSTREVRTQREFRQESLSAGRSPINQNWRITSGMEIRPKIAVPVQWRNNSSNSSSSSSSNSSGNSTGTGNDRSGSNTSSNEDGDKNEKENENENDGSFATSVTQSVRSSEDDITLNEMMGKFDESYVYEKETDILSDSDPTDCDDYIESLSDVDAVQDTGDENNSLDNDEMDYIDNGSFLELGDLDCTGRFPNTGHCTYFAFTGELARRSSRRESLIKRQNNDEPAIFQRTINRKNSVARKQLARYRKQTDVLLTNEKRKKKCSQRRKSNAQDSASAAGCLVVQDDDETANLNRALVERMLLKNSGFNQGSRSVGGTPICLRRRKHDFNKNLSPMRLRDEQASPGRPEISDPEMVDKRRSNSVSYVNGNLGVARCVNSSSGGGNAYMTTFASEIALMEADKEADKKYRELIIEAESILLNMQKNQSTVPIVPSPCRRLHCGLANKRVELIKNTELNIEHALSKSKNSQPELQSGSIRDLEHTSPKRQQLAAQPCSPFRRFTDRNGPAIVQSNIIDRASPDSPSVTKRRVFNCNGVLAPDIIRPRAPFLINAYPPRDSSSYSANRAEFRDSRTPTGPTVKEEGITSSSSDSEDRCDVRRRPPLMTFRSVDMGPIKEGSSYCPQSEPVKRKVYAGSATYGRIQKTLGEHVTLRNSDGDTATDPDTDDSRKSLKEKVAKLRRERLVASSNGTAQDSQLFQQQLSQLRRQMLMQTIQGLKRSLEDQSATLKQTCLEPVIADRLP